MVYVLIVTTLLIKILMKVKFEWATAVDSFSFFFSFFFYISITFVALKGYDAIRSMMMTF